MHKILLAYLCLALFMLSCKHKEKQASTLEKEQPTEFVKEVKNEKNTIPEILNKTFQAHGGFEVWNRKRSLTFTLNKTPSELHEIDLKSRKVRITTSDYTIGFDGESVWLAKGSNYPVEKARFYHNLYFYFYAMPFILGDPGIQYTPVPNLDVNGKQYLGYKISYEAGVGDSPDDNYFIYVDPETYKMEWLGYTVTYGKNEPSNEISFIHYSDWQNVSGLLLPKKLEWYASDNGVPTSKLAHKATFSNVKLSETFYNPSHFKMPNQAIEAKK